MKKFLTILSLSACLVLSPGCNSARLRDIDKQLDALDQEDKKTLKEMSDAIDELERTLMAKIEESKEKLNNDIDAAMLGMYALLHEKMVENQKYLEAEVDKRKAECDKTVTALYDRGEKTVAALDAALDRSQQDLQKAIENGDKALEQKLRSFQDKIDDTRDYLDKVEKDVKFYENHVDLLASTGMFKDGAIENLQIVLKDCEEFDLQKYIDRAGEELAWLSKVKLDELTKDRMEAVRDIVTKLNDMVDDATSLADESQSKTAEMSELVDDWSTRADEYYASLDDFSTEILDGYDEIISLYEDYGPEVDSWWSDLENAYENMVSDLNSIEGLADIVSESEDLIDSSYWETVYAFHDFFDRCIAAEDACETAMSELDSWVDEFGDDIRRYM